MKTVLMIINYNDAETTKKLLSNIGDYRCFDLVLVLDNGSTDTSFEELKKFQSSKTHVVQSDGNKGYAYAINFGCQYTMNLYGDCNVIVSNSDIIIHGEHDMRRFIGHKRDEIAILAPIIKEPDGISRGWKLPTAIQESLLNIVFLHRILRPRLLYYPDDYYNSQSEVEVEVILGCFFMIDTRYLKKANYYDENTFLYYEENIMAKKLKDLQAKTIVACDVEVVHNHSVSIDKSLNRLRKLKLLKQSQYYFQTVYQHANLFEKIALKVSAKMSYYILSILYHFR